MSALGRRIPLAVALLLAPSAAFATPVTYQRTWSACTSASFYTCNSISIATTAIMGETGRVGTSVVVRLHNLQGQLGGGNELWSALNTVRFYVSNRFPTAGSISSTTSLAGATGSGTWGAATLSQIVANGTWGVLRLQRSAASMGIGGCTSGSASPVAPTLFTCAAGSAIVLSFAMNDIFDADETVMFMQSNVANGTTSTQGCYTSNEPNQTFNLCNNITETTTVTPEPISMVLLGTGLAGLGGARLRRRKNTAD